MLKLSIHFISILMLAGCISAKQVPPEPALTSNDVLISTFSNAGLESEETPKGVVVYFPNVMFMLGSADISPQSLSKIQFVAGVSNKEEFSQRKIAIVGHTDSKGSKAFNLKLSKKRAQSVADSMASFELDHSRLSIAWHGELKPRVPNELSDGTDNPEGRTANRRVEVIFLN